MLKFALPKWLLSGAAVLALAIAPAIAALTPTPVKAMGDEPKPSSGSKCKKFKKGSKKWKECMGKHREALSDDELYYAAYWLARTGKYDEALTYLRQAKNADDPRILTYVGFTTRKLGRVDEAMGYYKRVLQQNPNYTLARAYMGEAFLQKGDVKAARGQLAEIAKRCGPTCQEFAELRDQILLHELKG